MNAHAGGFLGGRLARIGVRLRFFVGAALALSFGLLALVPLSSFREFAFAMVVGVSLEAFLVRPYLVPALLALIGDPSRRGRAPRILR